MSDQDNLRSRFQPPEPRRMIREVADGVWLNVEQISEVLIPGRTFGSEVIGGDDVALVIVMRNGNSYDIPKRSGAAPETMIRNLFTGGHE